LKTEKKAIENRKESKKVLQTEKEMEMEKMEIFRQMLF
jgi:hypothetical protein